MPKLLMSLFRVLGLFLAAFFLGGSFAHSIYVEATIVMAAIGRPSWPEDSTTLWVVYGLGVTATTLAFLMFGPLKTLKATLGIVAVSALMSAAILIGVRYGATTGVAVVILAGLIVRFSRNV